MGVIAQALLEEPGDRVAAIFWLVVVPWSIYGLVRLAQHLLRRR